MNKILLLAVLISNSVMATPSVDEIINKTNYVTYLAVETIQGYPTITKSEAKNLKTGGNTVQEYSSVSYNNGYPDNIFSERSLRKAPRKYLR